MNPTLSLYLPHHEALPCVNKVYLQAFLGLGTCFKSHVTLGTVTSPQISLPLNTGIMSLCSYCTRPITDAQFPIALADLKLYYSSKSNQQKFIIILFKAPIKNFVMNDKFHPSVT